VHFGLAFVKFIIHADKESLDAEAVLFFDGGVDYLQQRSGSSADPIFFRRARLSRKYRKVEDRDSRAFARTCQPIHKHSSGLERQCIRAAISIRIQI
jgi:hypothetical protein